MASGTREVTLRILGDDANARRVLDDITAKADRVSKLDPNIAVNVNDEKARKAFDGLHLAALNLGKTKPTISVGVSDDKARFSLDFLHKRVNELSHKTADIKIRADAKQAQVDLDRLHVNLARLSKTTARPNVDLEGYARVKEQIDRLDLSIDEFGHKHATATLHTNVSGPLSRFFSGIGGGAGGGLAADFMKEGESAGSAAGQGMSQGMMGAKGTLIGVAVGLVAALAPAIVPAAIGLGTALGGALLVGIRKNSKGKMVGPLVDMFKSLYSEAKAAAEPIKKILPSVLGGFMKFMRSMKGPLTEMFRASIPSLKMFTSLMERTIRVIVPMFTSAMRAIRPSLGMVETGLLAIIKSLAGFMRAMRPATRTSAQLFVMLGHTLQILMPIVGRLAGLLASLLRPVILLLNTGLRILGGLLKVITPILRQIANAAMPVAKALGGALMTVLRALTPVLKVLAGAILEVVHKCLLPLLPLITKVIQRQAGLYAQIIKALLPAFKSLVPALVKLLEALTPLIALAMKLSVAFNGMLAKALTVVYKVVAVVVEHVAKFIEWVARGISSVTKWADHLQNWGHVGKAVSNAFSHAWDNMVHAIISAWHGAESVLKDAWHGIDHAWNVVWGALKKAFHVVVQSFVSAWHGVYGVLSGAWHAVDHAWNVVWGALKKAFEAVVHAFTSAWHGVSGFLSGAWNGVKNAWDNVWGGLKSGFSNVMGVIKSIWNHTIGPIVSGLEKAWNFVEKIIHAGHSSAPSGGNTKHSAPNVPGAPHFTGHARGTSAAPPGWAWVGELGPELIHMRGGETVLPSHVSMAYANAGHVALPGYAGGTGNIQGLIDFFGGINLGQAGQVNSETTKYLSEIAKYYQGANRTWRDDMVRRQTAAMESADKKLAKVQTALANVAAYQKAQLSSLKSYGDIGGLALPSASGQNIRDQLNAKTRNVKAFGAIIKRLVSAKMPRGLISEIIQMGPDDGLAMAQAILSGGPGYAQDVASSFRSLNRAEKTTAGIETSAHFGAGYQKSLEAQAKGLTHEFKNLGRVLGQEAVKWLRSARQEARKDSREKAQNARQKARTDRQNTKLHNEFAAFENWLSSHHNAPENAHNFARFQASQHRQANRQHRRQAQHHQDYNKFLNLRATKRDGGGIMKPNQLYVNTTTKDEVALTRSNITELAKLIVELGHGQAETKKYASSVKVLNTTDEGSVKAHRQIRNALDSAAKSTHDLRSKTNSLSDSVTHSGDVTTTYHRRLTTLSGDGLKVAANSTTTFRSRSDGLTDSIRHGISTTGVYKNHLQDLVNNSLKPASNQSITLRNRTDNLSDSVKHGTTSAGTYKNRLQDLSNNGLKPAANQSVTLHIRTDNLSDSVKHSTTSVNTYNNRIQGLISNGFKPAINQTTTLHIRTDALSDAVKHSTQSVDTYHVRMVGLINNALKPTTDASNNLNHRTYLLADAFKHSTDTADHYHIRLSALSNDGLDVTRNASDQLNHHTYLLATAFGHADDIGTRYQARLHDLTTQTNQARQASDSLARSIKHVSDTVHTAWQEVQHYNGDLRHIPSHKDTHIKVTGSGKYKVSGSSATGGVIPGWNPGIDDHLIAVSGGEGILTPEATHAVGGARTIDYLNQKYAGHRGGGRNGGMGVPGTFTPGFATGGVVGVRGFAKGGGGGRDHNPFGSRKPGKDRIDQGVDYMFSGPIYAINDGVIMGNLGGWPGGPFIEERLTAGKYAGHPVYYSENLTSLVRSGQHVRGGQHIATAHGGLEFGFAAGIGSSSAARRYGQVQGGTGAGESSTAFGVLFNRWMESLGVPGGIRNPSSPKAGTGHIPKGWPTSGFGGSVDTPTIQGKINNVNPAKLGDWVLKLYNKTVSTIEKAVSQIPFAMSGGGAGSFGAGSDRQNLINIAKYMMSHGYSKAAAAGIAGNAGGESGGNPEASGTGGRGLIGWTPPGTLPNSAFTGNRTRDFNAQLPLILKYNHIWSQFIPHLNKISDPGAAAIFYEKMFERGAPQNSAPSSPSSLGGRARTARAVFHALATGGILREPIAGIGLHTGEHYALGERGPEMITPLRDVSGNATAAGRNVGHGGGDTYVFQVSELSNPDETARKIQQILRDLKRHKGNQPLGLA